MKKIKWQIFGNKILDNDCRVARIYVESNNSKFGATIFNVYGTNYSYEALPTKQFSFLNSSNISYSEVNEYVRKNIDKNGSLSGHEFVIKALEYACSKFTEEIEKQYPSYIELISILD